MRIVAISDTHKKYRHLKLSEGDILIHAGDFDCYRYSEELQDFNRWIKDQPFKHKIIICGNHDGYLDNISRTQIREELNNAIYLENEGVEIEGLSFWGSPITPRFGSWSFMCERGEQIKRYWDMIPDHTQVLITHGPPYGILDLIPNVSFDHETSRERVGCFDLLQRVQQLKYLKCHIFGHIHYSYGQEERNGVKFINASVLDEQYELTNQPIIIDL